MKIKDISHLADKAGICKEWFKEMKVSDIQTLCEMYFKGSDWSMEHDFPDLETLRQFMGQSERYGLFTDRDGEYSGRKNMAFFGNSNAVINYDGFSVSELILRHNSEVAINVIENAFLTVNVLDNAILRINCFDAATVKVFAYNGIENVNISNTSGSVTINKSTFK